MQKTAYEVRISDWSSDVCSSDLRQSDRDDDGVGRQRLRTGYRRGSQFRRPQGGRHRSLAAHTSGGRMSENLQATIDAAWEDRDSIGGENKGAVRQAVDQALAQLDTGAGIGRA